MSVEILLIPMAIAAAGTWAAKRSERARGEEIVHEVVTRMTDPDLLRRALGESGAIIDEPDDVEDADLDSDEESIAVTWDDVTARFARDGDGIWRAHTNQDTDLELLLARIDDLDRAYGRVVQAELVQQLRERAPVSGMRIESERVENDAVTLVLSVERGPGA